MTHLGEVLVVVRSQHGHRHRQEYPRCLLGQCRQRHLRVALRALHIDGYVHILEQIADPRTTTEVGTTYTTIDQRLSTLEQILCVGIAIQGCGACRSLIEEDRNNTILNIDTLAEYGCRQRALLGNLQRFGIDCRLGSRLTTVERIVDRGITQRGQRRRHRTLCHIGIGRSRNAKNVGSIIITHNLIDLVHTEVTNETIPIAYTFSAPLHLAQCRQTRQQHIIEVIAVGNILSPHIGLNTENMLSVLLGQFLGQFVRIDTINGQETANTEGFSLLIGRLAIVEIEVRGGNHHNIVTQLSSLDTAFVTAPRHHRSIGTNLAFENLVPTDHTATLLSEELLDAGHHVALQIVLSRVFLVVFQAQLLDLSLAGGALAPTHLRALVATDMDHLRGEELNDLLEYTLQQVEDLVVTCAEHLVRDTPTRPHLIRTTRATQLGICRQSRHHMTRQVDLGNNLDGICRSVLNNLANLILGIESTVRNTVIGTPILANYGVLTHRTNLGQLGEALDLNAPALIVSEVPMQAVELMNSHNVDICLHLLNREEMARNIEVHTTITKTGCVSYFEARQRPILIGSQLLTINLGGQQLLDSLDSVVETSELARTYLNTLATDRQAVALRLNRCIDHKTETLRRHCCHLRSLELAAIGLSQLLGKGCDRCKRAIVHRLVARKRCINNRISTRTRLNVVGIGNKRQRLVLGCASRRSDCHQCN